MHTLKPQPWSVLKLCTRSILRLTQFFRRSPYLHSVLLCCLLRFSMSNHNNNSKYLYRTRHPKAALSAAAAREGNAHGSHVISRINIFALLQRNRLYRRKIRWCEAYAKKNPEDIENRTFRCRLTSHTRRVLKIRTCVIYFNFKFKLSTCKWATRNLLRAWEEPCVCEKNVSNNVLWERNLSSVFFPLDRLLRIKM